MGCLAKPMEFLLPTAESAVSVYLVSCGRAKALPRTTGFEGRESGKRIGMNKP